MLRMLHSNRWLLLTATAACLAAGIAWGLKAGKTPAVGAASVEKSPPQPTPRVVVPEREFKFGVIDVGAAGKHAFVVKNEGDAELTLELIRTSCHCTLADIENLVVAPGSQTTVELAWQGTEPDETFGHGALIGTNDPVLPQFNLLIQGKVRAKMAVSPDLIYFHELALDSAHPMPVVLYSQAFDEVRITKIESTNPNLTVEQVAAGPDLPSDAAAKFKQPLLLTYRTDHNVGGLHGTIRVHYEAVGDTPAESPFEFHFTGEKIGDLSINGRGFTGNLLNMGTISGSSGGSVKVYLHVRNPKHDLKPRPVSTNPAFLQVRVGEVQQLSDTLARYPIEVVVPAGSPPHAAANGRFGEVVLATDHPDHPQVRFQTTLVVGP